MEPKLVDHWVIFWFRVHIKDNNNIIIIFSKKKEKDYYY